MGQPLGFCPPASSPGVVGPQKQAGVGVRAAVSPPALPTGLGQELCPSSAPLAASPAGPPGERYPTAAPGQPSQPEPSVPVDYPS